MVRKYLTPTSLYEEVGRRYDELDRISREISKRLSKYPEGRIHIMNKKGRPQYCLRTSPTEKTGSYISKKDDRKIRLYLQKKYDEEVLSLINHELKALESVRNQFDSNAVLIQNQYSDQHQEIKEKIIPIDILDADYINRWLNQPFDRKEIGEEVTTFITTNGEQVRSKSELTIANSLAKNGIPYKYECPLKLSNGKIIHPDFTVLNVKQRKEIFWEHRGMMDDEDYARNSVRRIKQLEREGIMLGDKLIITEETSTSPLGTDEIDRIIKKYLLSKI